MAMTRGIVSYGAYIPYWRLDRAAIAGTLGGNPARGSRSVASYDEDTTSMGVEAARIALQSHAIRPASVFFATAEPAYQDKTNATGIAAALSLGPDVLAADVAGAVRSGVAALHAGLRADEASLAVVSDIRTGLPASAEERDGGDGAAAFVLGPATAGPLIAEYVGGASVSAEFLDRWRVPGDGRSQVWEERFGESQYVPLAERALQRALDSAGITIDRLDRVVLTGLHSRAVRSFVKKSGLRREQLVDDLTSTIGNTGTAHPGVLLSSVLDTADPGQLVAVIVLADGADVLLFRTTEHVRSARSPRPVGDQITRGRKDLAYATFLGWRGKLEQEPPRRPIPDRPAGPPSIQRAEWKFAFTGSRCACGQAHLPPQRVCVDCGLVDEMSEERLSDVPATVATYTVDHLAYSMSPPVVAAVIDFDGGGRFASELTDVDPTELAAGTRVEMTFRRLYTSGGVHNYFWKARPVMKETTA
ncbi:hydroxymethylglutaryl-CoA synthase family protein [Rhodococcus sp. WS4]|nr:hydroxymethylglutaryl-CoA synthase family protein [Rhodococcus sp. WS4]